MADTDPVEITPTLQNATISVPAPTVENGTKHYYLSPKQTTVTLKADAGYIFETDGALTYQTAYSSTVSLPIKADKTDTATVSLPSDISWDDNFSFPLTMSATKKATPAPTPDTPDTPDTPTKPTTPTVTTQLDTLKNSLRIPSDLTDDDKLLQSYLDGATEYLRSTLDSDEDVEAKINSKRAKVVINALAEIMYQSRGDNSTVQKDFPFTLRALINQLKY